MRNVAAILAGLRRGRQKFSARPTRYAGVLYASKAEADRAGELDLLLRAGQIAGWQRQPQFTLGCPENKYRADFRVMLANGSQWIEDVKGYEPAKFKRDKKLWKRYGNCPLRILKRDRRGGWHVEVVYGAGAKAEG